MRKNKTRSGRIGAFAGVSVLAAALLWLSADRVPARQHEPRVPSAAANPPTGIPLALAPTMAMAAAAPKSAATGSGRAVYVEYAGTETQIFSAKHPQLEEALELEDADPAWTQQVEHSARELLAKDPAIRTVRARCAQTFCRLQIVKPLASALDWPEIDERLSTVANGEAIFQTEDKDGLSTGYLYFAARDTHLPLAALDENGTDDDAAERGGKERLEQ